MEFEGSGTGRGYAWSTEPVLARIGVPLSAIVRVATHVFRRLSDDKFILNHVLAISLI